MLTQCPNCKQNYEIDDEFNGKFVECSSCKHEFVVVSAKQTENTDRSQNDFKCCDYCKENINIQASKCKHCGMFLPNATMRPPCKHVIYVFLAIFFGTLGIHNFYAKRWKEGICQAVISIIGIYQFFSIPRHYHLTGVIVSFIPFLCVYISIIVNICTVYKDGDDVPFS